VKRVIVSLLLLMIAAATVVLLNSCASFSGTVLAPPKVEGATYVGDKACADCHDKITRVFPASPHARLRLTDGQMPGQQGCESCHGPGSKHIAAGGGRGKFIVNPGKQPETCFQCHLSENAQFHLPQHHPVLEGKMSCVDCHDPHGHDIMKPRGGLAMARVNESCGTCHREQTKPHVFEHAALREGCTACHSPHGSVNQKLLTIRDSNLCLRCHAQVQKPGASGTLYIGNVNHTTFVHYGGCWTAGCHSAVHGSNVQPYYFY
jgi:predicted CXXCH cytochrome family protein